VRPRWLAIGIAIAVVATFAPVATHDFVDYDDPRYVTQNPNFDTGLSLAGVWQDFRAPYFGNWIPLTHLSLRIDHSLYGKSARGYLITNVALHLLSSRWCSRCTRCASSRWLGFPSAKMCCRAPSSRSRCGCTRGYPNGRRAPPDASRCSARLRRGCSRSRCS
jgi:hypothetical protein